MYTHTPTIFNQLLRFVPRPTFDSFVGQHNIDKYVKRFSAWNLFTVMTYAQATGKDSLSDIVDSLPVHDNLHYHLWLSTVKRSTLAYANNRVNHELFEQLFYHMLSLCKQYDPHNKFSLWYDVYSLDATVVSVSLQLIQRAKYRTRKGAIKMHVLLHNKSSLPELITITDGKQGDVTIGKLMDIENRLTPDSIVVFDRAYVDYKRWARLHEKWISFVIRMKKNVDYLVEEVLPVNESRILKDEIITIFNPNSKNVYKERLRRIEYYHTEEWKTYVFLTNNFELSARHVALIYKNRWQIELFFKRIKQHLKIKHFLWCSENAVKNQIWTAMIYYLIVCYIKFKTNSTASLLQLTRILSESFMMKLKIIDILGLTSKYIASLQPRWSPQQLSLL